MSFIVPEPVDVLDLAMSDGAIIRVRRHGNAAGPRIVLSHGNGFAIDAYFPFWRLFLAEFEVIVFDQRNHGWNPVHRAASHTQTRMAEDLEHIIQALEVHFGKRTTAGAFHSLSTTVSLLHYLKYGLRWDSLILFDPPLAPPPAHYLHKAARDYELAIHEWALGRQKRFKSPEELASYFKGTRRMRRWVPGAAELMARAITQPTADGDFELVCPPEFEADIYVQNSRSPAWQALPSIVQDLFVVSSDFEAEDADPPAWICKALAAEFGISVARIPDSGHLLQIEYPEEVAEVVRNHLRSRRFTFGLAS